MIQSRLRELMATKSRRDQRRITYSDILANTGISTTTLTRLARDRSEKVALIVDGSRLPPIPLGLT